MKTSNKHCTDGATGLCVSFKLTRVEHSTKTSNKHYILMVQLVCMFHSQLTTDEHSMETSNKHCTDGATGLQVLLTTFQN